MAEDVFDELFKDKRIDKIMLQIEKLEIKKIAHQLVFKFLKKEAMKSSDLGKEVIKKELPLIPKSPGVYRMINHKGDIHYMLESKKST